MAIDPRIERKIRSVVKKQNCVPAFADDLIARAERGDIGIVGDRVRVIKTGTGVKAYVQSLRSVRPEVFQGPPQIGSNANPFALGDAPGAHEARLDVIRRSTALARSLCAAAGTDLAGRKLTPRTPR